MKLFKFILPVTILALSTNNYFDNKKINNLSNNEVDLKITQNIRRLNSNNYQIPTLQYNKILDVVEEKLGSEITINNIRKVYNMDYELAYYCVEASPSGYLIYDINLEDKLEYSILGESPYLGITGNAIYVGPGNYFELNGNQLKNIMENTILTTTSVNSLKETESIIETNKEQYIQEQQTQISPMSSDLNPPYPLTYVVDGYWYFQNLVNLYYPNLEGTCGIIALEMVLGYYDSYKNDNVVIESQDYITFDDETDPYYFYESPGVNYDFYTTIANINLDLYGRKAINGFESIETLEVYFSEYNPYNIEFDYVYSASSSSQANALEVKGCIEEGMPVIVNFYGYYTNGDYINHAAVAYMYSNGDIFVNMGHSNNMTDVSIADFYIYQILGIEILGNHIHSNNYLSRYNNTHHRYICPCGEYYYDEPHTYSYHVATNKSYHQSRCEVCHSYFPHPHNFINGLCTDCGLYFNSDEYNSLPE